MAAKRAWNKWRTIWLVWIGVFLVIEGIAVFNNEDDDTLSEFVWDFVTIHPIGWVGIAGLLGWLAFHFLIQKDSDDKGAD